MSLESTALDIFGDCDDIVCDPGNATVVPKNNWSDKTLDHFLEGIYVDRKCAEHSFQKAAMVRFLNFYSSGEVPRGYNTFDVIAAAILIMPTQQADSASSLLFPVSNEEYKNGQVRLFYADPIAAIGEESRKTAAGNIETLQVVESYGSVFKIDTDVNKMEQSLPGSSSQAMQSNPLIHDYTRAECASFLTSAKDTLSATDATEAQGQGMIHLRKVFGYLALTLLRGIVKDKTQLATAFSKTQYRRNFLSLLHDPSREGAFSPPCLTAINKTLDAMLKNHQEPRHLFAFVVLTWMNLQKRQESWASSILAATVLTHTAYNGLQMFHMLTEIAQHYSLSWKTIGENLYFSHTQESWRRIMRFLKQYSKKDGVEIAYPWARIIDDTYLMEYSAKRNFQLCVILAGIIEICQNNPGVWESNWVKTRLAEVDELKFISQAFCDKYSVRLTDMEAIRTSRGILENARRLHQDVERPKTDDTNRGCSDSDY